MNSMSNRFSKSRTLDIALLVKTDSEWHRGVIQGIASCRTDMENWIFTVPASDSNGEVALPENWDGDGIICRTTSDTLVESIRERGVPVVNISWLNNAPNFPVVASDEAACAQMVGGYFLEKQHANFGYVGPPPWQNYRTTIEDTLRQFVESHGCSLSCCPTSGAAKDTMGVDQEELADWINDLPKPCAITVWSSFVGYLVIVACIQLGFEIPRDVSIVCIEHDPLWSVLAPVPLSNIDQDPTRVGHLAGQLIRSMILDEETAKPQPILVKPIEIVERLSSKASAVKDPVLGLAIEYIHDKASSGVTVLEVAKMLGISRRTLEEKFKSSLDCPPAAFIRRYQIREVCRLLRSTDLNIATIAKRTGFSYPEVLMRVFRREHKITPTQYRNQYRKSGS